MHKTVCLLLIAGVCLLAWTVFVFHTGAESMWYDEWYSWHISTRGILGLVTRTAEDVHPPLYYVWLWVWMQWTGSENLLIMRLSSAIPAVLAVAFTYRVGRDWFRSHWAGMASALFLACSGFFIYYARELRMYTLVVLLVTISWWMLYRLVNGKRGSVIGYGASLALLAYTYYFAAFIVLAQALIVLMFFRHQIRRALLSCVFAFVALIPWLPALYHQILVERSRTGDPTSPIIGKFGSTDPTTLENIVSFINAYTAGQPAFALLLMSLGILACVGIGISLKTRRWLAAALLWFFLTTVVFFALNLYIPVYNERYPLYVLPGLALLVGLAAYKVPDLRTRLGIVGLIAMVGLVTHTAAFLPLKTPHEMMLRIIADHYQPGDRIWYNFAYGGLGSSLQEEVDYYLTIVFPQLDSDYFVWDAPNDYADVNAVPRVWDVRPYWIPMPDEAAAVLMDGRALTEEYPFDAYSVHLYEAPPVSVPIILRDEDVELALRVTPLMETTYAASDTLGIETWWQMDAPLTLDYSYSLTLERDGVVVAQTDAGLTADELPTSQWALTDEERFVPLELVLPPDLPTGRYRLTLAVYYWENPTERFISPTYADGLVEVAQITVD